VDKRTGGRAILLTSEGARLVQATTDVALDVVLPLSPKRGTPAAAKQGR
jgi:hypothetical protein